MRIDDVTSGATTGIFPLKFTDIRVIYCLVFILLTSLFLNLFLAVKNTKLASEHLTASSQPKTSIGSILPSLTVNSLDGKTETISYGSSDLPTVLYFFTPECTWCKRNLNNLKTLTEQRGNDYRFIGISIGDAERLNLYKAENNLEIATFIVKPEDLGNSYKVEGTPQTIVISSSGKVIQNWTGAYIGEQGSEIERFFNVHLPGVSSSSDVH
jgi:thioredoxin-related protein